MNLKFVLALALLYVLDASVDAEVNPNYDALPLPLRRQIDAGFYLPNLANRRQLDVPIDFVPYSASRRQLNGEYLGEGQFSASRRQLNGGYLSNGDLTGDFTPYVALILVKPIGVNPPQIDSY